MIIEVRLCDLDEPDAAREAIERHFMLDGHQYSIDLCARHSPDLDKMAAQWVSAARKASKRGPRRNRDLTGRVRAWAVAQGLITEEKGRIPEEVWARYRQEHGS